MRFFPLFAGVLAMTLPGTSSPAASQSLRGIAVSCETFDGADAASGQALCAELLRQLADRAKGRKVTVAPAESSAITAPAGLSLSLETIHRSAYRIEARLTWKTADGQGFSGPPVEVQSMDATLPQSAYKQLVDGLLIVAKPPL